MTYSNRSVTCSITREQLYRLVWSEPMIRLAEKLGLSGRGLAKMCERHRVPRPGRGYWQKKQHGHSVEPKPLPELKEDDEEKLSIVRFSSRTRPDVEGDGEGDFGSVIADQKAYEDKPENEITVPDEVDEWHGLMPSKVKLAVSAEQRGRAHRIMNTLLLALEDRGFEPRTDDGETLLEVHGVDLPILIREKREQVEKKYREMDRVTFRDDDDTFLDLEYTGRLELKIDEEYAVRGVRKKWRDGKTQRVEGLLNDFMVGLVRAAVAKAKREQRFEEARRRRKREREERRKRKRRAELRKKRRQDLHEQAKRWEKAERIRRYVAAVRKRVESREQIEDEDELREWLAWAEEYAEAYDPLNDLESVPSEKDTALRRKRGATGLLQRRTRIKGSGWLFILHSSS